MNDEKIFTDFQLLDLTLFGLSNLSVSVLEARLSEIGLGVGFENRSCVDMGEWGENNIVIDISPEETPEYSEFETPLYLPKSVTSLDLAVADLLSFCLGLFSDLSCDYLVIREDFGDYYNAYRNDLFGIYRTSILNETSEAEYVVKYSRTMEEMISGVPPNRVKLEFTNKKRNDYEKLGLFNTTD